MGAEQSILAGKIQGLDGPGVSDMGYEEKNTMSGTG
jgi:hypothetical protein